MSADTSAAQSPRSLPRPDGTSIAYHKLEASPQNAGAPGVIFIHGLMSDMEGGKALHLEEHCRKTGRGFIRFDTYGHGKSSGRFPDGTIGRWREDLLAILDEVADGPQVLVGSSMGGWLMLLGAIARPDKVAGLVGIAPAPDFTEDLMLPSFTPEQMRQLEERGRIEEPSEYSDEPYVISKKLLDDGRSHLLLRGPMDIRCPVRLLHGMKDDSVPWEWSLKIQDKVASDDVEITFIKTGDHRLSEPADLDRLTRTLDALLEALG
ncbi:2-hydroxymuconic semialdehyde hydrolase [Caenispirillum salinarum AK4]|uniref:Palmitoyl-protein thioesterase ABHD10, mitochondrial n=1 Tax=Caenispirillum salinarum AK4 TaxID=1238182 RepID=K9HGF9_9PROT|nr:alpha/beta hydrolase [Caenispirillum salinarum]EKV27701.1 2-hydroxymuconic semialdehyde hydrolase [Caenispirillum salinarum AK4]